jgi:branched-chain amino acid transport system permease protein
MGTILSVFVIGISFGSILFLLATGLSLTMGLMRIVNMAHGALYMLGGFVGLAVAKYAHNFWIGVLAGAVCAGLIGLIMEVGFLRRLFKQEAAQVLLTIGFVYILMNVAQWIWGTYPAGGIVPHIFSGSVRVGNIDLPAFRLFLIGFGLVMAVLLWLFQDKTKIGAMVRAGMDNREIAGALGINLRVLFSGIFALGSLVAGLCGLVGGYLTGINLGIAWEALLLSLIVVVIGGTGSIQGALLGGVIIGLLNAFGVAYFPQAASFIVYGALIVILLVKPSGLLGRSMHGGGASEGLEEASGQKGEGQYIREGVTSRFSDTRSWQARLTRFIPYLVVLAVLIVLPPFTGTYFQGMMTKVLIFAIFAMSLDLTMGYTGLVSFGHAAFLGTAGYAVGILIVHAHITSFWVILPAALAITAVLSAVIGYISLRVSGVYFILVTMAFGQLLASVATKWYSLTGGRDGLAGIPRPDLGIHSFNWTSLRFYYFVFIGFIISFYILHRVVRSSFGRTLVGIRQNEARMRSLGFNTWASKYVAVMVGGTFAGLAGALFAYFYGTMVPSYLSLEMSALPMLMVIIGGAATLYGPCLGAAVIIFVQYYAGIYLPDRWPLILGGIFVVCVMLLRGGFARYLSLLWSKTVFQKSRGAELPECVVEKVEL